MVPSSVGEKVSGPNQVGGGGGNIYTVTQDTHRVADMAPEVWIGVSALVG